MKMARKIKYLRLHTKLFIPGVGDLGDVLPDPRKSFSLQLTDLENGVLIDIATKEGVKVQGRIPDGNIALAVYLPEEVPAPKPSPVVAKKA